MRHALWLGHWHVDLVYERLEDDAIGQCKIRLAHQRAEVCIDPAAHETEGDVLDTLRHELLHLACGYFDHARQCVHSFLNDEEFSSVDQSFTLGAEHSVSAMERFLDGNGLTSKKLVENGRRELGLGEQEE